MIDANGYVPKDDKINFGPLANDPLNKDFENAKLVITRVRRPDGDEDVVIEVVATKMIDPADDTGGEVLISYGPEVK